MGLDILKRATELRRARRFIGVGLRPCLKLLPLVVLVALVAIACGGRGESQKVSFPIIPSQSLVERGQVLYNTTCATCHGNEKGEGRREEAPPHNSQGHTWHHADRQLFEWVLDGPPLRTIMPAFRGQLSNEEVVAVIAYIKTMWPEEIRKRQTEFSGQYEEQVKKYGE